MPRRVLSIRVDNETSISVSQTFALMEDFHAACVRALLVDAADETDREIDAARMALRRADHTLNEVAPTLLRIAEREGDVAHVDMVRGYIEARLDAFSRAHARLRDVVEQCRKKHGGVG